RYSVRRAQKRLTGLVARIPLRWRLTLLTFGMLAVLLTALGTVVSVIEEQTLLANQANVLHGEARWAATGLRDASGLDLARPQDSHPVTSELISPNEIYNLRILIRRLTGSATWSGVYTANGQLLLYSGNPQDNPPDDDKVLVPPPVILNQDTIVSAIRGSSANNAFITATDKSGQRQLVVLIPIEDVSTRQTVALLEVSTSTAPIDAAVASTRLILLFGIGGALLVAFAVMLPLMSAGLRPLVAMERASRRIAAGALSLRLEEPPTNDEIGRLARSFNSMVAQLEAAFARQKRFVADVSHELRTPLTALGGGLEMLMLGADRGDPEASRRLTRGMYHEVERMRRLVEDLLTLTRLDEGRARLRLGPVAVDALVAEVAEQAERLAPHRSVHTEVAENLPAIRADADYLRQVVLNLLDNAFKYTPEPGTATLVALRGDATHVILEVRDTGIGIPPDALPHVFERFYRADPARARTPQRAGGAGLGLSIAKGLVEAQGGQIEIASKLNVGTTVTLRFPTLDAQYSASGGVASSRDGTQAPTPVSAHSLPATFFDAPAESPPTASPSLAVDDRGFDGERRI
ncbi:MAG TPA: ATP-binding protein, partial [Ktedonobacterales bacterium]